MRPWRALPGEEMELYSPIGLRLVDDLTGRPPFGPVRADLDLQEGGDWHATDLRPVITPSSVVAYPGLGRVTSPLGQPPRHYRVRLAARFYRPLYLANLDGIEFDAHPYNDTNPPAAIPPGPVDTILLPAPAYPFEAHVPVLRGRVENGAGEPVANALVREGLRERVLTDERGAFSLPLRWVPPGAATPIDAIDQRTGETGAILVTLPADLTHSHTIIVV